MHISGMTKLMRIGARGQVVIPKRIRDRYGLQPRVVVEFVEEQGRVVLRVVSNSRRLQRDAWDEVRGLLKRKVKDVDRDIEEMRGR